MGERLRSLFPNFTIYAQLPCFGTRLKLDFYIHTISTAFEFDANQHDTFVPHFHKSLRQFRRAQERDYEKDEWCEINEIKLVRVTKDNIDQLEELIRGD